LPPGFPGISASGYGEAARPCGAFWQAKRTFLPVTLAAFGVLMTAAIFLAARPQSPARGLAVFMIVAGMFGTFLCEGLAERAQFQRLGSYLSGEDVPLRAERLACCPAGSAPMRRCASLLSPFDAADIIGGVERAQKRQPLSASETATLTQAKIVLAGEVRRTLVRLCDAPLIVPGLGRSRHQRRSAIALAAAITRRVASHKGSPSSCAGEIHSAWSASSPAAGSPDTQTAA